MRVNCYIEFLAGKTPHVQVYSIAARSQKTVRPVQRPIRALLAPAGVAVVDEHRVQPEAPLACPQSLRSRRCRRVARRVLFPASLRNYAATRPLYVPRC